MNIRRIERLMLMVHDVEDMGHFLFLSLSPCDAKFNNNANLSRPINLNLCRDFLTTKTWSS